MKPKTYLDLDFLSFAHRLKIQYEYSRGGSGGTGWTDGIIVDIDDASRIIAARDTARAAGQNRLNAKRARERGGRK